MSSNTESEDLSLPSGTVNWEVSEYHNQIVRLADLTTTTSLIEGATSDNCQIGGPAVVILPGRSTLTSSGIQGSISDVIWEIADERRVADFVAGMGGG